jgi:60S ribosome subunit biogenesis protein NIP7
MRPLSEDETKIFFEKLTTYIGRNVKHLIDRPDEEYCFRLHKERVYYLSQALARSAQHVERNMLVHMGTCFGKFTKSLKFRLHVTCLDYLAQYAKYKVWVKPSSELSYLYGNNVLKAGLGRITENTPQYQVTHQLIACLTFEPPALPTG